MSTTTKQKDGRNWKVDGRGIVSLSRDYVVCLDAVTGANGEIAAFTNVPSVGSAHPSFACLKVVSYDVKEGSDAKKQTITVTVNYEREEVQTEGEGQEEKQYAVESWGWDASTAQKELSEDFSSPSKKVVNAAGDPFDKTPMVEGFAPVFTKVFKSKTRISGAQAKSCNLNSVPVAIGDMTCAARTLLCTVGEEAIIGDAIWKYRYRVQMKYRPETWDVTIVEAGMRARKQSGSNEMVICTVKDFETGRMCRVTSPALLNPDGTQAQSDSSAPYFATFKAYPETDFPTIFTSEPIDEEPVVVDSDANE